MKGDVTLAGTIMGTLLGIGGVIALLLVLEVNISSVSAEIQHGIARTGGLDIAHAVDSCLARGTGPVPVSALEEAVVLSNQASANTQELFGVARYVQEQCGRGIPAGIGLRVQDLETGKMWSAGYAADAKKRDQAIAVVIADGEVRHAGLLTIQV